MKILFISLTLCVLQPIVAQNYTSQHVILYGAHSQVQEDNLSAGALGFHGTNSVIIGQPVVGQMSSPNGTATPYVTDLGFWSFMLQQPAEPVLTAGYEIFPNRIRLDWVYDKNQPPPMEDFTVKRGSSVIASTIPLDSTGYMDDDDALNVGTEYTYTLIAENSFGDAPDMQVTGKTSTNGTMYGRITTTAGSPVRNVEIKAEPNWGNSLFFDGTDDYVALPDNNVFEFGAAVLPNTTVELWIRPSASKEQCIISKGPNSTRLGLFLNTNNKLYLKIGSVNIFESTNDIPINDWTHVALRKETTDDGSGNETVSLQLFVNGMLQNVSNAESDSSVTVSNVSESSNALRLGEGNDSYFRGYMDELRVWNVARSQAEISRSYDRYEYYRTEGAINHVDANDSPTMVSLLQMNGGSGTVAINSVNQALNGTLHEGVAWSATIAPAYASGDTDEDGFYEINNVNYTGVSVFTLTPTKPAHEFDPPYLQTALGGSSPAVQTNQNFVVTNMISITGYVRFANDCPVENVMIHENGQFKGVLTNDEGFYRVEVEPGADMHIRPVLDSRDSSDFNPQSAEYANVIIPKTKHFTDLTMRQLDIWAVGGTDSASLGPNGMVSIRVQCGSCYDETELVNPAGYVDFDLPPHNYEISVVINPNGVTGVPYLTDDGVGIGDWALNNGRTLNTQDSYDAEAESWLGEQDESFKGNDSLLFMYRSPVNTAIRPYSTTGSKASGASVLLGDYQQNTPDSVELKLFEKYYSSGVGNTETPVDTGYFIIFDRISDRWTQDSDTVRINFGSNSTISNPYKYYLLPGQPNITGDFLKTITVVGSDTSGIRIDTELEEGVVLGHKPQMMDFTTVAPELPYVILRRPPGDGSSASYSSVQSHCTEIEMFNSNNSSLGNETNAFLGVGVSTTLGLGVATTLNVNTQFDVTASFSSSQSMTSTYTNEVCIETESVFETATSGDEGYIGRDGDLFIGGALNLLYGETKILENVSNPDQDDADLTDDFMYALRSEIVFVPDGFATDFIFTRGYIEDSHIPELEDLAQTDSTKQQDIDAWERVLAYEDSLRWVTDDTVNYTFVGGAGSASYSKSTSVTASNRVDFEVEINNEFATSIGFDVNEQAGLSNTTGYSFGMSYGSGSQSTTSNTNTSSFTLSDDDVGDDYTVSVGNDPVYGTPVFNVIAGHSSCPYEEWHNEDGEVVTEPMDVPTMTWRSPGNIIENVLPDNYAELNLEVQNQYDEAREYHLALVSSSNIRGAIVTINGAYHDENNPIIYTLDGLEVDTVQIVVEQGGGDYYEYENLTVRFASACEIGGSASFTENFSVSYARPCTEAEFYNLGNNWVMNTITGDTTYITVNEYDLNQTHFDSLELQYRPLGADVWYKINEATLIADSLRADGSVATSMQWIVENLQTDGVYDLRLRSVCLGGLLTNELPHLRGTIDREVPTVLGAPEPVDNVLNIIDEIALNFTEDISAPSVVQSDVTLVGAGLDITDITVTVSENRLVVEPNIPNSFIENKYLTATLSGYDDFYGNPGDTISWTFLVNRNPLSWNTNAVEEVTFIGDDNSFVVPLNNIGSSAKQFEIVDVDPTLITVDPLVGEINPGGSFNINFSINNNLNVGEFDNTIKAETADGDEFLAIDVISMCHYPDWEFDVNDYLYTMNVVAEVKVKGTLSEDVYDRLGAFINGEPRGFSHVQKVETSDSTHSYLAFVTVYSNFEDEQVSFHVWDRTGCVEYWNVGDALTFGDNDLYGSVETPLELNATGEISQDISYPDGYNWFSINVDQQGDVTLDDIFANMEFEAGDRVIGQDEFATYSADNQTWEGSLTEIDYRQNYVSDFSSSDLLNYIGFEIWPDTVTISLDAGWNWVGYLPNRNMEVNTALALLTPATGDVVKGQVGFAQYAGSDVGWVGNLTRMFPGEGYKFKLASADEFNYPNPEGGRSLGNSSIEDENEINIDTTLTAPWQLDNLYDFEYSMNIIALVESDTFGINDPFDMVAALVDGQVRGTARPIYIPQLDAYRIFLTVYSNEFNGESIEFRIWDNDEEKIYKGAELISFVSDEILGSVDQPLTIEQSTLGIYDNDFIPDEFMLSQNYPNPFNPITKIGIGIPEYADVQVVIYDILGREVKTLFQGYLQPGYQYAVWNGTTSTGQAVGSGVYFVVMEGKGESKTFRDVKKMMLLK